MDINKMRNIVILKDLPSNLVEEAFVVLKENQKIKKIEYAENRTEKFSNEFDRENEDEFVIKEAELLISSYINKLENQNHNEKKIETHLMKKYKVLKIFAVILSAFFIVSCVRIFNIMNKSNNQTYKLKRQV